MARLLPDLGPKTKRWLIAALVFTISVFVIGWNVEDSGLASNYVDPVAKVTAQDEAVYASTSIHIATQGGWLSPLFLGRYAFYKPPLLYWLSAIGIKAVGVSAIGLRLPSLIAGASIATLVFLWLLQARGIWAALIGLLLLHANHLFHVLSRVALTDALLVFCMTAAIYLLWHDPTLDRRTSAWGFGLFAGAAIMTKGIAGTLPLLILGLYWVVSWGRARPSILRLMEVFMVAGLVALPWHFYQLAIHPRWFWAEYILTEHVTFAVTSTYQSTAEDPIAYYARRLFWTDPFLLLAVLLALPGAFRQRAPGLPILISWCAVVIAAVLAFQYRNSSYLLPLIPALCLFAAEFAPSSRAVSISFAAILFLAFGNKIFYAGQPWGVPYAPESVNASAAPLEEYCARQRSAELIVIAPDDQFYSADLPLQHVRYCYLDPSLNRPRYPLDFEYLGITVSATQFREMDHWRPIFSQRLHDWGLPSDSSIATVVLTQSREEIRAMIAARPEYDFSLPVDLLQEAEIGPEHQRWMPSPHRLYLLARNTGTRPKSKSPCEL